MIEVRKALAFFIRDFYIETSYRFSFFLQVFNIIFWVAIFYFIAKLFGEAAVPHLASYGGDYFSFVLIGIAFYGFLSTGLSSFAQSIRREQVMGTLESVILTPMKLSTFIIASSLWSFLYASIEVLVYLILGTVFFGAQINFNNFLSALIILLLTILSFSGIGIISASFIMAFKRGNPINWVISTGFALFGGVYFPVSLLPPWLQKISYLLPITYSLRGIRQALLGDYSLRAFSLDVFALTVFAAVILPLAVIGFRYAVKQAKIKGTLTHY